MGCIPGSQTSTTILVWMSVLPTTLQNSIVALPLKLKSFHVLCVFFLSSLHLLLTFITFANCLGSAQTSTTILVWMSVLPTTLQNSSKLILPSLSCNNQIHKRFIKVSYVTHFQTWYLSNLLQQKIVSSLDICPKKHVICNIFDPKYLYLAFILIELDGYLNLQLYILILYFILGLIS